jgi:NTE family protein
MIGWRKEKVAFAISGGGARGAIQVGMLRALLEESIRPDLIVGTSVGAWNGGWLAQAPTAEGVEQLANIWRQVNAASLNIIWWRAARNLVRRRPFLYDGSGMSRLVANHIIKQNFEDLEIPFHAIAINLTAGTKAVFNSGPLAPAVLASSAIPGMFPPVLINGEQYVDGGGADPTGLETALELGARRIYVLNSGYAGRLTAPLGHMNAIVDHTFQVAAQLRIEAVIRAARRHAEIIHLRPSVGFLKHSMDFGNTEEYMAEGYRYARLVLHAPRRRAFRQVEVTSATAPATA